MNARSAELRNEVMALRAEERAELAVELFASLDDGFADADLDEVERAWGDEMVRRSEQIASGEVDTVPWDDVLERVAANRRSR